MTSTNSEEEESTEGSSDELESLTSGVTDITVKESSSLTTMDTSFGLVSLVSENGNCDEFLNIPPEDVNYLAAVDRYMAVEPVYRPKKSKVKVVRRLQTIPRSVGYSRIFREVQRRRPPVIRIEEDEPTEEESETDDGSTASPIDSLWLKMLNTGF